MSEEIDEMAERYSKKWGVPLEEAKKKVQKFLEKKPVDRSKSTPSTENLFPEPIGPLSEKIQDINQAVLSSAYTKHSLMEMSQPPEELKTLHEKVDFMENTLNTMVTLVNTTMKDMQGTLEAKKADEERQQLVKEISEKVIQPLRDKIAVLEKTKGEPGKEAVEGPAAGLPRELSPEEILKTGQEVTENARKWLERFGYKVELPKALTLAEVEATIKEKLEAGKEEWEKVSGAQVEIEKERIRATEDILIGVTDRIFKIFLEPLKDQIHEAIEKGALRAPAK